MYTLIHQIKKNNKNRLNNSIFKFNHNNNQIFTGLLVNDR